VRTLRIEAKQGGAEQGIEHAAALCQSLRGVSMAAVHGKPVLPLGDSSKKLQFGDVNLETVDSLQFF
jgi:hypothetical protein